MTIPNPYADFGIVVTRPRLVGRADEIRRIVSGMVDGRGSAALVGEPRVGKSSIACAVREELESVANVVTGWIDLGSANPERGLIAELTSEVGALDSRGLAGDADSMHALLKKALRSAAQNNIRHFVVIDEFDAIRGMGRADLDARRLRELIYRPHEYGLSVLLVTRRRIGLLEQAIPNLSTLDGVCRTYFVKPLQPQGIRDMVARAWPDGLPEAVAARIWQWLGGHPYLTEALLCSLFERQDLSAAEDEVRDLVRQYFDHLARVLSDDGALRTAIDIGAGRPSDSEDALTLLRQYGVVVPPEDGLALFASSFRDYLGQQPSMPEAAWATELRS